MSNYGKVTSAAQLNSIIFKDKAHAPVGTRFFSLFPGLGYAAAYKVLQRVYKYGGQPFVRDYLAQHYGGSFDRTFGKGNGKAIMHATAGRWAAEILGSCVDADDAILQSYWYRRDRHSSSRCSQDQATNEP